MASDNPFSPTFGASPPVLAGRGDILDDIDDAMATGPTHPDYTVLFIGVRGSGKTVMLNATEDLARQRGWLTITENASPAGLVHRLTAAAITQLARLDGPGPARQVTGVSAAGFGVTLERTGSSDASTDLRSVLTDLGARLARSGTGLLITVDELLSGDIDELRDFGAVLQHVTRREQLPVAFAGASLPQIDDTLLADHVATFLQRCSRHDIDRLDPDAVETAIGQPIIDRGGRIGHDDLRRAVAATSGYAFMVQLVGFHMWKAAHNPTAGITTDETTTGVAEAERRIGRLIFAPTWKGLSDVDRRFLLAMARDDASSPLSTIAKRLGVDTNYAGVYRHRLIGAGMVSPAGRGRVDFTHHATRGWIRSQAAYAAVIFADDGTT